MLSLLNLPVMTAAEAARQLKMPTATLRHWLEGGTRGGRSYDPVLRVQSTGTSALTWGEFVEARYLRSYRSQTSVRRLRVFVRELREQFQVPYPLAHITPYVDGNRDLVYRLQERADVPGDLLLVLRGRHGQYLLNPLIKEAFVDVVDFAKTAERSVERVWPLGRSTAVVQDPRVSSGASTVRGVRTATLRERFDTGTSVEELCQEFDLVADDVRSALRHEWSTAV